MLLLGGVIPSGEKKMGEFLLCADLSYHLFGRVTARNRKLKQRNRKRSFWNSFCFLAFVAGRFFLRFLVVQRLSNLMYSILVAPAKAPRPVRNFSTVLMGIWFEVAWNIKTALQLDSTALRLHIWVILEGYPTNIIGWKIHRICSSSKFTSFFPFLSY